jgi:hypothetical protein
MHRLMLLGAVKQGFLEEVCVELSCDVAPEAADRFGFGLAFGAGRDRDIPRSRRLGAARDRAVDVQDQRAGTRHAGNRIGDAAHRSALMASRSGGGRCPCTRRKGSFRRCTRPRTMRTGAWQRRSHQCPAAAHPAGRHPRPVTPQNAAASSLIRAVFVPRQTSRFLRACARYRLSLLLRLPPSARPRPLSLRECRTADQVRRRLDSVCSPRRRQR